MKKVLFVATIIVHIETFHTPYLKWFKEQGWEVHIAARGVVKNPYCDKMHEVSFRRSPFAAENIRAYKLLKDIITAEAFDLIHCHTPVGGVMGRLCARKQRKEGLRVVYTAHGFHFYKGAPIMNWLIYYPAEKLCSYMTDVFITLNKEDYKLAKAKMRAKKVYYVPGVGIDTEKFANTVVDRKKKRAEIGMPSDAIFLLSVGELSKRKNHELIIRTIGMLKDSNIYYCIAGEGDLKKRLKRLAETLGVGDKVYFLGYRNDVNELCKVADVFCFPSLQEGLPVSLMEAMACGLPCVASRIRGNVDLIEDNKGGMLAASGDAEDFAQAIARLVYNKPLRTRMGAYNKIAAKRYGLNNILPMMESVYLQLQK